MRTSASFNTVFSALTIRCVKTKEVPRIEVISVWTSSMSSSLAGAKYLQRHFANHEGNAFSQQRLLTKVMVAQHLCACSFIKSDVTGVVNHTTGIGIFVVDPNRPSKQRCIHFTSR